MRAADYENGPPKNIFIGNAPIPILRPKEILIRVIASAINRADTLQRQGKYDPPAGESKILGLEAAGFVHELHPECEKPWKVGDKVMALLSGGGNAEFVAVHEEHVMPVPSGMSFDQAAAIPETWLTSYQLLHIVGNVQPNDFVLIHAGGSGVATAAIQLCQLANVKSIVTAGSNEKIDVAKSLGAIEGINYKEKEFAQEVKSITDGKGANLILDCIGGSYSQQNLEAIAFEGHWVVYGLMGGVDASPGLLRYVLGKRLKIEGTTLRTRSKEYKAKLVKSFAENILPHFESGKLKPIIDSVLPFGKLGEAHQRMEDNKNIGKIVIQIQSEETPVLVTEDV